MSFSNFEVIRLHAFFHTFNLHGILNPADGD